MLGLTEEICKWLSINYLLASRVDDKPDVGRRLTDLQFGIYFIKAPVHIAVTVGFFKKVVQNIPSQLSLIHHQ